MIFPPATDFESWLRLSFAAMPTARAREALRAFSGPQALLDAALSDPKSLEMEHKLSRRAIEKLQQAARRDVSEPLAAMHKHAISIVPEAHYPPLLTDIRDDTPAFLFARGAFAPADAHCIAIVGTRQVTEYGRGLAHRFALEFARAGWTVVSGLALGIDSAAHRGALDGGGRTIAVTGCGLDMVYPSENRDLMLEIENSGAVVSEWAPTTPPASWHFPARNRVIAGLSCALVVVEAKVKSGALISANFAVEHDRLVFAVPGNVHKPQSQGPHQLIQEGAVLAQTPEDVLEYLSSSFDSPAQTRAAQFDLENGANDEAQNEGAGATRSVQSRVALQIASIDAAEPATAISRRVKQSKPALSTPPPTQPTGPRPDFSPTENRMWLALDVEPRHLDDITQDADLEPSAANAAMVMLEIKGAAKRLPGNLFVKVV